MSSQSSLTWIARDKTMPNLYNKEIPENPILSKEQPQASRPLLHRALQTGANEYRVGPLDDIQKALNAANSSGGGRVHLQSGTYVIETPLIGYSNIEIIGDNATNTTIDFNSSSANISFDGNDVYDTGTITSITSGVMVTGLGTSWLDNVTTDHQLFIGERWYKIVAVTSNTTMILGEGFAGLGSLDSFPGVSYRAAKVKQGIEIKELTIKNSTGTGITFDDCKDVILEDVIITGCNKGAVYTNSSSLACTRLIVPANTSNGVEFTNCGFGDFDGLSSAGNGGHGMVLSGCRIMPYTFCSMSANTNDGVNVTDCDTIVMEIEAASNGGQGVELVSGNHNIYVQDSLVSANTGDGVKLTATSDNCKIVIAEITSNGGYGVNIAASTCDNTIISNSVLDSNTSGQINDEGVGSSYSGNKGIPDKSTEEATNRSGSSLAAGDVVVIAASAASDVSNPDADPETSTVDGMVIHSGENESYSALFAEAGTTANDSDADTAASVVSTTTTDQYSEIRKIIALFDTSAVPAGATISTATLQLYCNSKSTQMTANAVVRSSAPASNTALVAGDYDSVGTTDLSDTIAVSAISTSAYNTWTLNASGRAAITAGGITKLAIVITEPTWVTDKSVNINTGTAESANPPILTVNYVVDTTGEAVNTTTTAGDDKVFGMAEETITNGSTGSFQTLGKTTKLKVNGTTDISIGDFLTTYTEAGISAKAIAGDMVYAIALEAYTANDSNGVIDARLISPRKL